MPPRQNSAPHRSRLPLINMVYSTRLRSMAPCRRYAVKLMQSTHLSTHRLTSMLCKDNSAKLILPSTVQRRGGSCTPHPLSSQHRRRDRVNLGRGALFAAQSYITVKPSLQELPSLIILLSALRRQPRLLLGARVHDPITTMSSAITVYLGGSEPLRARASSSVAYGIIAEWAPAAHI